MERGFDKLFSKIEDIEPPIGLTNGIAVAIQKEQKRSMLLRIVGFSAMSLASLVAFVPSWYELQSEATSSGFTQFMSLIYSDFGLVMTYWKDFSLSILGSLPVLGIALVFGSAFIFLLSIRLISQDLSKSYYRDIKLKRI